MRLSEALRLIEVEYVRNARIKHPQPFVSPHEGWAIIKEELDEVWDLIKSDKLPEEIRDEVKQVGATALRFLIDLC